MKPLKTIIIGAGSIGALKPDNIESIKSKKILTHAHAIYKDKRFKLSGIIDTNKENGIKAAYKWGTVYCKNIPLYASTHGRCDVAVIACDTKHHISIFKQLIRHIRPHTIIIEKPCGNNLKEAKYIFNTAKRHNIQIVVNYNRGFCKLIPELQKQISNDKILAVNFFYQRGLKRDGCHALHLLCYLLGSFISGIKLPFEVIDYIDEDPTIKAHLEFKRCKNVTLIPCDGREFCIFELEIITNKKRIKTIDYGAGINVINVINEKIYGNYKTIGNKINKKIKINLSKTLENMYNYTHATFKYKLHFDNYTLDVWKIIEILTGVKK